MLSFFICSFCTAVASFSAPYYGLYQDCNYCGNSVLDRLGGELHLVYIELLVHKCAELGVIHLPSPQNAKSLLLQGLISSPLCSLHLLLNFGKFYVAFVNFGLNHFSSVS